MSIYGYRPRKERDRRMGRVPAKVSTENKAHILQWHALGYTLTQIASTYGVGRQRIWQIVNEARKEEANGSETQAK